MKIVHVISGVSRGGTETMLYKLVKGMDPKHFRNVVVSLTGRGDLADDFEAAGTRVLPCNMERGRLPLSGLFRLAGHLHREKPDIVQTWLYHPDVLGGLVARFLGTRHIVWNIRHSNLDRDKNKWSTLLTVRLGALLSGWIPEYIISNSANAAVIHQGVGYRKDRFLVIPNGFDTDILQPDVATGRTVRQELEICNEACIVGSVARFHVQKNHQGLVEAAAEAIAKNPDIIFVLAGRGVNHGNRELAGWIRDRGIQDNFRLLGQRDDIARLNTAFDIAVCASWGEGFPNTVGEAMSCGVPAVVTDVGDCADIVGDTGLVVQPGDMSGLARNILRIARMTQKERDRIGTQARERIIERYSIGSIVTQYEDLYRSMLSGDMA